MTLVWCDIETTGLVPDEDIILEIGVVVTTDSLEVLDQWDEVFWLPDWYLQNMSDVVKDMHTQNGLIEEARARPKHFKASDVDQRFADLMAEWVKPHEAPFCGSSIRFDRAFLEQDMPAFHGNFHYRQIDVSTLKETARRYAPGVLAEWVEISAKEAEGQGGVDKAHRALADIHQSIAEYKHYVSSMRNMFWKHPAELTYRDDLLAKPLEP
jgi:oligoribonuclease